MHRQGCLRAGDSRGGSRKCRKQDCWVRGHFLVRDFAVWGCACDAVGPASAHHGEVSDVLLLGLPTRVEGLGGS